MSAICLGTDPDDDGGMFNMPHRCTLDRGHAGNHQSADTSTGEVLHAWHGDLNPWMQEDDLFWTTDAGLDALTLNPLYGYMLIQPGASDADWIRARQLLDEHGGATDCTRLDNDVIRYDFAADQALWEHVVHI